MVTEEVNTPLVADEAKLQRQADKNASSQDTTFEECIDVWISLSFQVSGRGGEGEAVTREGMLCSGPQGSWERAGWGGKSRPTLCAQGDRGLAYIECLCRELKMPSTFA